MRNQNIFEKGSSGGFGLLYKQQNTDRYGSLRIWPLVNGYDVVAMLNMHHNNCKFDRKSRPTYADYHVKTGARLERYRTMLNIDRQGNRKNYSVMIQDYSYVRYLKERLVA